MNKSFKSVIILAVLAVFGVANAQQKPAISVTAPKVEVTAPKVETPVPAAVPAPTAVAPTPAAAPAPAPIAVPAPTPAPAVPVPAKAAPAVPAPAAAVTAPAVPTPAATPAPAASAPAAAAPTPAKAAPAPAATVPTPAPTIVPAPIAAPAPVAEAPPQTPPVAAEPAAAEPAPIAEAQAAPKADSTIVLIVEEPKKKRRSARPPKNDFAIVDVPANFEIQARKIMPIATRHKDDDVWGRDNLDTWWGRANLMVLTESENFVGKVHLRMYPGQLQGEPLITGIAEDDDGKITSTKTEVRDLFQVWEAWAWHRGDYVNIKIGRWDNTTRFGSKTFGGYIDAKKNVTDVSLNGQLNDRGIIKGRATINNRASATGFMSVYTPENALQFGLNNLSENISLDIALVSGDNHLNRGDLRVYFAFKDLAGLENVDIGLGYRSNVFDEVYNKRGDVTHTVDFGFRMPLVKEVGILKNLNLFVEAALIGLDDKIGTKDREDNGGSPHDQGCDAAFPILGGLDFSLYHGLDKLVLEVEYDGHRKNATADSKYKGTDKEATGLQGSIYVQRKLNDRFTLNLGVQSENNTKDFSFAGRLQGRIN